MLFANTKTHFLQMERYHLELTHCKRSKKCNIIYIYHFSKKNYTEAKNFLFDENKALGKKFDLKDPNVNRNIFTVISSWKSHYNSWKQFKKELYLIKYEDLIRDPHKEFSKLVEYLSKLLLLKNIQSNFKLAVNSNSLKTLKN